MNIGLLLPSALMYAVYSKDKIFAPKQLFLDLTDALVKRGHSVFVYSSSDTKTTGVLVPGNDIIALKEPPAMKLRNLSGERRNLFARRDARWEYELDLTNRAYKDALSGKIDVIHSYLDFSAHYFSEVTHVPTVYTLHDPFPDSNSLDYWRFKRFPNDYYVAISKAQLQQLSELLSIHDVVYHGIDISRFTFQEHPKHSLLFLGRYMKEKGVADAIHACIKSGVPITIAGSREYTLTSYYQREIVPLLSNQLVQQTDLLDSVKRNVSLGNASALLFPIRWEEPFGMVMIEAMAAGTPVIAYNRGSVPEIVADGVTGFIIDPPEGDDAPYPLGKQTVKKRGIEGLVEAIRRIGEIDRRACRRRVEEHFTVGRMVEEYERVYAEILHAQNS